MLRPSDQLKRVSASVSAALNSAGDLREFQTALERQLRAIPHDVHQEQVSVNNGRSAVSQSSMISPIGIWQPAWEDEQLFFVRPKDSNPWGLWADVERIEPKGDRLRVVLLGESVARGFLLDPYFNVAIALQTLFNSSGHSDVEVVDLARSAQTFVGLEELLAPALALQPNAYVLFAGNNWHIPQPELLDFEQLVGTLQQTGSMQSFKQYIEGVVKEQVSAFVTRLGAFSAAHGIPIVFIIPDYNLMDWHPEYAWQNPLLISEQSSKRPRLIAEAESALAAGNLKRAESVTWELIELDEGSHPAGLDLLAECRLKQENFSEVRPLKENVKDFALIYPSLQATSCYSVIQNTLRQEGPAHGVTIVDLPQRFAEHLAMRLPDRHFFFDNVHMTVEGIRLAAASAVEKLLPLLGKNGRRWCDLNQFEFEVEPRVIAMAHFGAACANARQGQEEIVAFHCSEAVRHDPRIVEVMRAFLNMQRPNPLQYVKRFEDMLGTEGFRCLRFLMRPFSKLRDRRLFPALIRAVTNACLESVPDIAGEIDALINQEYRVTGAGLDLLRGPFMDLSHAPLEARWWDENGYFKSYQQQAKFRIICEHPCSIQICLTYRMAYEKTATKSAQLLVNGVVAAVLPADTRWNTWDGVVSAELFTRGINSIVVSWPEPCLSKAERIEEVIKGLGLIALWGDVKDIYIPYGEIHDFRVYAESSGRFS